MASIKEKADQLRNNVIFQQRWLNIFDMGDKNKDGLLTMDEILEYADRLQQLTNKSDKEIHPLRESMRKHWKGMMDEDEDFAARGNWVKNVSYLAAKELDRIGKKEPTQMQEWSGIFFGLVDLNHDNTLSPDEFAIFCKCFGFPDDMVDDFFTVADTNKNGKLEWDEFYNVLFDFWYKGGEGDVAKLYGGHI